MLHPTSTSSASSSRHCRKEESPNSPSKTNASQLAAGMAYMLLIRCARYNSGSLRYSLDCCIYVQAYTRFREHTRVHNSVSLQNARQHMIPTRHAYAAARFHVSWRTSPDARRASEMTSRSKRACRHQRAQVLKGLYPTSPFRIIKPYILCGARLEFFPRHILYTRRNRVGHKSCVPSSSNH